MLKGHQSPGTDQIRA